MSGGHGIEIDTRHFPVVVNRWMTADLDDADVSAVHASLDALLARGTPFVTIVDGTRLSRMPPPRISRALERWVEDNEPRVKELSCGTATIARSVLARGVARWVLHQRRVKTNGTVVRSYAEAVDWAVARLKSRGISVDEATLSNLGRTEDGGETEVAIRTTAIDEDRRALVELVASSFSEPAFLLDGEGQCIFMNASAVNSFGEIPVWLKQTMHDGHYELKALCRVVPLELGGDAFLVVPADELVPRGDVKTPALELPASLQGVAVLLAQGLSDKEISTYSELSVNTVRTYVARIFKRTRVHSRGEFIRQYARALDAISP